MYTYKCLHINTQFPDNQCPGLNINDEVSFVVQDIIAIKFHVDCIKARKYQITP